MTWGMLQATHRNEEVIQKQRFAERMTCSVSLGSAAPEASFLSLAWDMLKYTDFNTGPVDWRKKQTQKKFFTPQYYGIFCLHLILTYSMVEF